MLKKLGEHIANCLDRAAKAELRAAETADRRLRLDNERMARRWRHVARSYQSVEGLETSLLDEEKAEAKQSAVLVVRPPRAAFEPDTIAVMAAAYDKAVELQSASVRENIAKRVIELASAGELDPDKLCNGALAFCMKQAPVGQQEEGINYSVECEGQLWHCRVFAMRGVQIGHGATRDAVLSRCEAINFASDPAKIKDS